MRVYIAGPYTGDVVNNVRKAIMASEVVLQLGHTPFIPHLSMLWQLVSPKSYNEWIDFELEWLMVCDAVLCIGSSPGSDLEVAFAMDNNIPVFFNFSELNAHESTRTNGEAGSPRSDSSVQRDEED